MEISSETEPPCLDKFQREALLCLDTFPEKVLELNNLIDEYAPEAIKKSRGSASRKPATSCLSINSTTRDYYLHDAASCCSMTTWDRCKSRSGIRKRKYRLGRGGVTLRRRSRPLAQILAVLVNRLSVCTQAMVIRPSRYIIESIAAMFLQREQLRHVQCGTSTFNWNELNSRENSTVVSNLICIMRPAAVRLIADTTILKRWLQALALASTPTNLSLAQAIRTTETIDGWAYELFFHLKYLQVINFPDENEAGKEEGKRYSDVNNRRGGESRNLVFPGLNLDLNITDDVMHTNLWHRVVQLRDHYVILYETLRNSSQFIEAEVPK